MLREKSKPIIGIYKITNPEGKIYIGQSIDINKRKNCHGHNNKNTLISKSLKKFGKENHSFKILEECDEGILRDRERFWQDHYDTINNGLNMVYTKGNGKKATMPISIIEAMKKANTGSKNKAIFTESRRLALSLRLTERHMNERNGRLRIDQYDLNMNYIRSWNSLSDAARELNINLSGICSVLKGRRNRISKFIFKYKEDQS